MSSLPDVTNQRVDPHVFEGWTTPPATPGPLRTAAARLVPRRRLAGEAEQAVAAAVQAEVEFPLLTPRALPWRYRLAGSDMVPACSQLATLVFRGPGVCAFRLTQRLSVFSVAQELRHCGEPHTQLHLKGRAYSVIGGAWIGEPCGWNWQTGRRTIAWEQEGRICEIEQVLGLSPPLAQTLMVATSLERWSASRPT